MTDIGDLKGATTPDGRYAMFERRGSGSFGTVYRGRDNHLERDVAIKLIDPEEATLDATLTEARIQLLCTHPNVVAIHDVRIEPPVPLIVMEYVEGGSAEDQLEAGISLVDALRWTRNALQGLAHAHGLGILHRDLKPGNLLLLANGEAAISDFGIAEDTIRGRAATDKHYWPLLAPEILERRPTSAQSDIWAMGCLLYRLLTGRWPFTSLDAIANATYDPPQQHNPQVPRALTRAIEGALRADLNTRHATAREMLAALARCRSECSWSSRPEPESIEAWETNLNGSTVIARLLPAPRTTFQVEVTIDRGSAARRAQPNQRFNSEAQARVRLATILRNGVEGKSLR